MTAPFATKSIAPILVTICIIVFVSQSLLVSSFLFPIAPHTVTECCNLSNQRQKQKIQSTYKNMKVVQDTSSSICKTQICLNTDDDVSSEESSNNDNKTHFNNLTYAAINLLLKELWFLPLISLLSGIPPSMQIIGQSHISRMPDCPIAHDVDTMLLWPAVLIENKQGVGVAEAGKVPFTLFEHPFAAVTDISMYNVDWSHVLIIYGYNVIVSLVLSLIVSLSLVLLLSDEENEINVAE